MVPRLLFSSERRSVVIRVIADSVDLCGMYALSRMLGMLLYVRKSVSCDATTRSRIFECVDRLEIGW